MKRKILCAVLIISSIFLKLNIVNASDDGLFPVSNEATLRECIAKESACKLTNNVNLTSDLTITTNIMLDLNGNSILPDSNLKLQTGLIRISRGSKLTISDSKENGKISTGDSGNIWAGIKMVADNNTNDTAELVINSGTIEGYYYGIIGNVNEDNTKITINGGTIKALNTSDSVGIFQPQEGDLIINGGTISGGTGIELRAGNLTINDGTVTALAPEFTKMINGNGTTTAGVAIAIAQHTTKKPINVQIKKGNFTGEYAFYEWNPHQNSSDDINKIKLSITGGTFTGTATGVEAIYSEDFTKFVSGGTFSTQITKYLTDDANVSSINDSGTSLEINDKKGSNIIVILISILLIGGFIGLAIYKKSLMIIKIN